MDLQRVFWNLLSSLVLGSCLLRLRVIYLKEFAGFVVTESVVSPFHDIALQGANYLNLFIITGHHTLFCSCQLQCHPNLNRLERQEQTCCLSSMSCLLCFDTVLGHSFAISSFVQWFSFRRLSFISAFAAPPSSHSPSPTVADRVVTQ
jgi:hypothetical protein